MGRRSSARIRASQVLQNEPGPSASLFGGRRPGLHTFPTDDEPKIGARRLLLEEQDPPLGGRQHVQTLLGLT